MRARLPSREGAEWFIKTTSSLIERLKRCSRGKPKTT